MLRQTERYHPTYVNGEPVILEAPIRPPSFIYISHLDSHSAYKFGGLAGSQLVTVAFQRARFTFFHNHD